LSMCRRFGAVRRVGVQISAGQLFFCGNALSVVPTAGTGGRATDAANRVAAVAATVGRFRAAFHIQITIQRPVRIRLFRGRQLPRFRRRSLGRYRPSGRRKTNNCDDSHWIEQSRGSHRLDLLQLSRQSTIAATAGTRAAFDFEALMSPWCSNRPSNWRCLSNSSPPAGSWKNPHDPVGRCR